MPLVATYDYTVKFPATLGFHCLLLPYSEVCMASGIAGTEHWVEIRPNGVYLNDGRGPHITYGEAGIYDPSEPDDQPYYYGVVWEFRDSPTPSEKPSAF